MILLCILLASILFLVMQNQKLTKELSYQLKKNEILDSANKKRLAESPEQIMKKKEISYFLEDVLPGFPSMESIASETITDIFMYTLDDVSTGWFIETESNDAKKYYLVSNNLQKELGDIWMDEAVISSDCIITNRISRRAKLIIEGANCSGYGIHHSVAVIDSNTGEKIKLTGNFPINYQHGLRGTTTWGTASGNLIGVVGLVNPQIIVSYWGDIQKSYSEGVRSIAYFDLKTGKLIKVDNFD